LVDLGRCKELQPNDPMMTSWQSQYDSAWAPFSARDPRDTSKQENCVKDPKKIKVVRAIGRNMGLLHQGGYDIVDGKLIRKFDPQEARRKQEEAARQKIAAQAKAQAEAEAKRKQEEAARQKAAAQARAKAEADAQRQVGARQNAAAGGMAFPVFKSSGSMFSATAKYCRNCGLSP
jgi:flagellar biosynthesis/type III secretory pathway protein FliH